MRNIDENRVEKFIKQHKGYRKWLAFVLCLALITASVTLYILNKPAVATTTDTAETEVGMVLNSSEENAEADEEQQNTDNEDSVSDVAEEETSDSSSSETSNDSTTETSEDNSGELSSDGSSMASSGSSIAEDASEITFTAKFQLTDGSAIEDVDDENLKIDDTKDLSKSPKSINGFEYVRALINNTIVKTIKAVKDENESVSYIYR